MSALVPAPLSRTDIARIWREVTGGTQMDQCSEEFARRIERAAVEASAAHELLEALIRLLDDEDEHLTLQGRKNLARAAIAKAGGAA